MSFLRRRRGVGNRSRRTWPGIVATVFAALACLGSSPAGAESAARARDERARPALWLVADSDTRIYLFGTIHILRPDLYWFTGPVRDAFREADEVVLEMKPPSPAANKAAVEKVLSRQSRKDAPPMAERLPPEHRDQYRRTLESLGLAPDAFDKVPPWMAGVTLSLLPLARAGYDPERGADRVLALLAADASKPVVGLETLEEQFALFDGMTEAMQVEFLVAAMEDGGRLAPQLDAMIGKWSAGDIEALAAVLNEGLAASPAVWKLVFEDRNERWAEWIAARMRRPGTVLVAVGAGHLAGRGSLQDRLARRKLEVRRVGE